MDPVRIAFVSSEVAPFAKTGGLADVSAALPRFLGMAGHDVRVFMPRYATIDFRGTVVHDVEFARDIAVRHGGRTLRFSLSTTVLPGTDLAVYLIHCPELYDRATVYALDGDEHVRFSFLARAAIESCQRMGWGPDVFHVNDWHVALLPLYLRTVYGWDALFRRARTVLTIHNHTYQGVFPAGAVAEVGLAEYAPALHQDDLRSGVLNFLKTGILYADVVTAVSKTYADEIRTPALGEGLDDLLRRRGAGVVGIVNGVDYGEWNPATDPHIPSRYGPETLERKAANGVELLRALNLEARDGLPTVGMVTRLTPQKGIDLLPGALPDLLARNRIRLALLGSGEERYERLLQSFQDTFPGRACFYRGYNERLAHLIEAGSDLFLMPSKFEPCGLNQMYSLKYGTPPVVRRTGGLADTVAPFDPRTGEGDGFVFEHFTADGLRWALHLALEAWRHPDVWRRVMLSGMAKDYSWEHQAPEYVRLYRALVGR